MTIMKLIPSIVLLLTFVIPGLSLADHMTKEQREYYRANAITVLHDEDLKSLRSEIQEYTSHGQENMSDAELAHLQGLVEKLQVKIQEVVSRQMEGNVNLSTQSKERIARLEEIKKRHQERKYTVSGQTVKPVRSTEPVIEELPQDFGLTDLLDATYQQDPSETAECCEENQIQKTLPFN